MSHIVGVLHGLCEEIDSMSLNFSLIFSFLLVGYRQMVNARAIGGQEKGG